MGTLYDEMTESERRAYTRKLALEIGGELLRSKTATILTITADEKRDDPEWLDRALSRVPIEHRAAFRLAHKTALRRAYANDRIEVLHG